MNLNSKHTRFVIARVALLPLFCALLCAVSRCLAQNPSSEKAFDEANKLYAQGRFTEAIAAYEALLKSGKASAPLLFNFGNACFKDGQIGRAIVAYRRAEMLASRDADIQANLKFARNRVGGASISTTAGARALGKFSIDEWTLFASGSIGVFWLLLALGQWRPALKSALRPYLAASAVIGTIFVVCVVILLRSDPIAVVIKPEAIVRQAPLTESQRVFTANDGAELRVVDAKDEWLQVNAGPNRQGWILKEQVQILNQFGVQHEKNG